MPPVIVVRNEATLCVFACVCVCVLERGVRRARYRVGFVKHSAKYSAGWETGKLGQCVYTHTYTNTNTHTCAKINNFIRCTDQFLHIFTHHILSYACLPFPFYNSYSSPCTPHRQSITAKDAHLSVQQQQQQQCFAAE